MPVTALPSDEVPVPLTYLDRWSPHVLPVSTTTPGPRPHSAPDTLAPGWRIGSGTSRRSLNRTDSPASQAPPDGPPGVRTRSIHPKSAGYSSPVFSDASHWRTKRWSRRSDPLRRPSTIPSFPEVEVRGRGPECGPWSVGEGVLGRVKPLVPCLGSPKCTR